MRRQRQSDCRCCARLDAPPVDRETQSGGRQQLLARMESVGKECGDLKRAYEECFNSWFSDRFLRGSREDTCAPLFTVYQSCVKKAIQERKLGP